MLAGDRGNRCCDTDLEPGAWPDPRMDCRIHSGGDRPQSHCRKAEAVKLPSIVSFVAMCAVTGPVVADPPSAPYSGQQARSIKALSPENIAALLTGEGMGMAKAAELNGYPGPAHVLALAKELNLTEAQRA